MAVTKKSARTKAPATKSSKPGSGAASTRPRSNTSRKSVSAVASGKLEGHRAKAGFKQDLLIDRVCRPEGAKIDDLTRELGWLPHTVRAALTGLRRKGYTVTHAKSDSGKTVYRATPPAAEKTPVAGRGKRAA